MNNFRKLAFLIVLTVSAVGQERPGKIDRNSVLLPNRWRLSPAGRSIALGDFPLNMAVSPEGRYLAVNHNGQSRQFVAIVGLQPFQFLGRSGEVSSPLAAVRNR